MARIGDALCVREGVRDRPLWHRLLDVINLRSCQVAQHGQVLTLHGCRSDGKARWANRYRVDGSFSKRPQVGGFATRDEAQRALRRELARLRPGREMTVTELVEEYLKIHQAAPSTIEKLRWLLSKATAVFGDQLITELRSEEICAWRGTLPEGHRFEATQALRQVLNATVAWELIEVNPARRGVPNPLRRFPEKRRSSRGSRSTLSPRSSTRSPGRWLCSGPRRGSGRPSLSRSSSATSTGPAESFTSAASPR